jgi:hypothetical protein
MKGYCIAFAAMPAPIKAKLKGALHYSKACTHRGQAEGGVALPNGRNCLQGWACTNLHWQRQSCRHPAEARPSDRRRALPTVAAAFEADSKAALAGHSCQHQSRPNGRCISLPSRRQAIGAEHFRRSQRPSRLTPRLHWQGIAASTSRDQTGGAYHCRAAGSTFDADFEGENKTNLLPMTASMPSATAKIGG